MPIRPLRLSLLALASIVVAPALAHGADGIIGTLAGTSPGFAGDGGAATQARLDSPGDVATAPDGGLLIADTANHRIRRVAPDGIITTVAGTGPGLSGDGGPATSAQLSSPRIVVALADGSYLIADSGNGRLRRVDQNGIITTLAAGLTGPRGVTPTADGGLLIADTGGGRILRRAPDGTMTQIAGLGLGFAADGASLRSTGLSAPTDVVPLGNGGLLIADAGTDRLRRVTPLGAVFTVAGGRRGVGGDGGPASLASLDSPAALTVAADGAVLVADSGNGRIRRMAGTGALPAPDPLRTVGVAPVMGTVTVRPRTAAVQMPLVEPDLTPNVSVVDARRGAVRVSVRPPDRPSDAVADVSGGRFRLVQPVADTAVADLRLQGPVRCAARPAPARAGEHAKRRAARRAVTRRIRIKVRGRYRTSGRYATAVANGTAWTMTDRCDRTVIRVTQGTVTVRDQRRNRAVKVRAGRTYVALARPARP